MDSKSIPELLKRSLQSHMAEADLREDKETQDIIAKLSELSDKVAAAKARALANRAQRLADESKGLLIRPKGRLNTTTFSGRYSTL